ncbi:P-loop NTPase fold protein [Shewanella oncorhynchi]|uniref:P-loop NTPase fold protein n=1 Tax=Shewanella oncorhynchi TaxID=2726434 RepID=UPI0037474C86
MSMQINVNSQYTRSVNLERDYASGSTVSSYIPTSRSKRLLERISESLSDDVQPRAWSLIGPYGSGKSSFSVFLSHLLSEPNSEYSVEAFNVLETHAVPQTVTFREHTDDSAGYLKILISGSPEPLASRIFNGLKTATLAHWNGRRGKKPDFIRTLEDTFSITQSTSDIVKLFALVQNELEKDRMGNGRGILLVIDELGKFLEYEARHYGANDIFLLQELAELACRGHKCNLLMFVLLHQSFEQYAKGLGETLKNEWAKVQGRFEEIPFLESSEQTLKIVSKAIVNNYSIEEFQPTKIKIENIVTTLLNERALPSALEGADAIELFSKCYPLHPISALILPHLCQKLAQNERTLFNFLGSTEDFGFVNSIKKMSLGDFITPDVLFDYFITNQSSVVSDHITHRRWAEVITAVDRLGSTEENTVKLLKTIGLFNIINSKGTFKASETILKSLNEKNIQVTIAELTKKSIITYRAFNNEFRVWQGSDFDLDEALQEQLNLLGNFSLSQELNEAQILKPIVARKYSVENGALRYFVPVFTDAQNLKNVVTNKIANSRIVFFLAYGKDDLDFFNKKVLTSFSETDILVLCRNSSQLKEAFAEVVALRKVEATSQALKDDPVAKKEYFDRRNAAEYLAAKLVKSYELEPQDCEWFFEETHLDVKNRRDLQSVLSSVLAKIFNKSPSFHNELINRDKPSSQANAGRNKLLASMLQHPHEAIFGIEKFPPEKAMYLSILKKHGLHQFVDGKWKLIAPIRTSDLYPTWKAILAFFDSTKNGKSKTFEEISQILVAPPYGIKFGMLPIIFIHALLVHEHELAIFEDGVYIPYLTIESIERFVKVPHFFKVESFKIEGLNADIFEGYKNALFDDKGSHKSLLEIAKPLAKFFSELELYTQKTRSDELSIQARKLIKAFSISKSPQKLLFEGLPIALGFDLSELSSKNNSDKISAFSNLLIETLRELKYHYKKLLEYEQKLLCNAFNLHTNVELTDLRKKLARYDGLDQFSVDTDGLKAFIMRLTSDKDSDVVWLEGLLAFLASKSPKDWLDADRSKAEFNLSDYAKRISELELLRIKHEDTRKHIDGDFDVILLKSLKKGVLPRERAVAIDDEKRKSMKTLREKVKEAVNGYDDDIKLALYAELVDEFLGSLDSKKTKKD